MRIQMPSVNCIDGLGGPVSLANFVQDGTCCTHIILRRTRSVFVWEFRCLRLVAVIMYHDALGSVWTSEDYASKFCRIFFGTNNRLQLNIMWGSTWLELTWFHYACNCIVVNFNYVSSPTLVPNQKNFIISAASISRFLSCNSCQNRNPNMITAEISRFVDEDGTEVRT